LSEIEEPDRLLDFPHPGKTPHFYGHEEQTQALHRAITSGRFPHAWIFSGPEGIGKATLAYRLARFILKYPPGNKCDDIADQTGLDIPVNDVVFQQVAAQSHPGLKIIKRPYDHRTKRLKGEIPVDEIRSLHKLFNATTTDGGWRIALIDCADEMNRNAANALLKMLEEPPKNSAIILISHQSGALLPTIRSRCRMLQFNALPENHILQIMDEHLASGFDLDATERTTIARLANGSAGNALQLACGSGLKAHENLISLLESLPRLNGVKAHEIAERLSRRDAQDEFRFFRRLLCQWLNMFVRFCTTNEEFNLPKREYDLCQRLGSHVDLEPWLEVWEKTQSSFRQAEVLNLDKRQLLLTIFFQLESAAKQAQKS
jgi:DNA polymerase III subunit delta'